MRREPTTIVIVVLVLLVGLAVFWGLDPIEGAWSTLLGSDDTAQDPETEALAGQLAEAVATLDALEGTATAVAPDAREPTNTSGGSTPLPPTSTLAPTNSPPPSEETESTAANPTSVPATAIETVVPTSARASSEPPCSQDSQGNPVCYPAANVIDGETDTAWRETASDNLWIEVALSTPMVINQVAIVGGYAKIDPFDGSDRWRQNWRPRRVRVYLDEAEAGVYELVDTREWQQIEVGPQQAQRVRLEILDSYPPLEGNRPYVAVSEIRLTVRQS